MSPNEDTEIDFTLIPVASALDAKGMRRLSNNAGNALLALTVGSRHASFSDDGMCLDKLEDDDDDDGSFCFLLAFPLVSLDSTWRSPHTRLSKT